MIKKLKEEGLSISAIAKRLGCCRDTVRKYLNLDGVEPPKIIKPYVKSKVDPYLPYIAKILSTAKEIGEKVPSSYIYEEIKKLGYDGSLRRVQEKIKNHNLRDNTPLEEKLIRFETKPGVQMQVDWIEFPKEGLSAFVATLGYSRMSYVEYVANEKLETLIICHLNAFNYFGGVPSEVLYDNMKTVILERNTYGKEKHKFNSGFADFAKHCGFKIKVCRPYRAKTKGKVERFNHYLRYSFHKPFKVKLKMLGIHSMTKELVNNEAWRWLEHIANARIHSETLQQPSIMLKEEQSTLKPTPLPYQGISASIALGGKLEVTGNTNRRESATDGGNIAPPLSSPNISIHKPHIEIPKRDLSIYDRFIPNGVNTTSVITLSIASSSLLLSCGTGGIL